MRAIRPADLAITGDSEATMPLLIQAIEKEVTPNRRSAMATRGQKLKEQSAGFMKAIHQQAAMAWNASPISTARMSAEVWNQITQSRIHHVVGSQLPQHVAVSVVGHGRHYNSMGRSVGGGVGYTCSASLGAALANKQHGRLTVSLNGDGDLMMSPQVLWTAAHHQIPILYMVHNNRAYHQETCICSGSRAQSARHGTSLFGTTIDNPNVDFATLAKSMGVYSIGPIDNPADLGPAITRALDVVKRGEPALIDVVSQPR